MCTLMCVWVFFNLFITDKSRAFVNRSAFTLQGYKNCSFYVRLFKIYQAGYVEQVLNMKNYFKVCFHGGYYIGNFIHRF